MRSFVSFIRKLALTFTAVAVILSANLLKAEESKEKTKTNAEDRFDLTSSWKQGETQHVGIELEVGGFLTVTGKSKVKKLPMSVVAKLAYDETLLLSEFKDVRHLRSVRDYQTAEAVIKVEKSGLTPKLPDSQRRLLMDIEKGETTLFHAEQPIIRDHLDLISVVGNSLAIDELLPRQPVKVGEKWAAEKEAMMALLGLDAIATCEITSELTAVEDDLAKVMIQGTVTGAAEGVATEIEMKAKYHFNLTARRITGFNLAAKEKRSIGHVAPGLEVIARLKMQLRNAEKASDIDEEAMAELTAIPAQSMTPLLQEAEIAGFRYLADRRWFVTSENDKLLVLRYVDRGDLVAQCNLTPILVPDSPDDPMTLEKYQHEVRLALGKNFGQFIKAGQWVDESGQLVFRVTVQGAVDSLPIEWRYYLITHPTNGRRVAAVYTIEASLLDRFADADRLLVDRLELRDDKPNPAATPESAKKSTAKKSATSVKK